MESKIITVEQLKYMLKSRQVLDPLRADGHLAVNTEAYDR